jgi:hypothetical protein
VGSNPTLSAAIARLVRAIGASPAGATGDGCQDGHVSAGTRRVLLAACLVAAGCVARGGDDAAEEDRRPSLTPTFVPAGDASTTTSAGSEPANGGVTSTSAPNAPGGGTAGGTGPGSTGASPTLRGSLADASGDLTLSLDPPPRWADLTGGSLERTASGYRLAISFAEAAPERAPDGEHTLNVASFYDLDGDGRIDVEVWANLADSGWGAAVYDRGGGRFGADSGVTLSRPGGQLVLAFPLDVLERADGFRWSLATEWGSYAVVGTDLAARDDAPDDDRPATFPS